MITFAPMILLMYGIPAAATIILIVAVWRTMKSLESMAQSLKEIAMRDQQR